METKRNELQINRYLDHAVLKPEFSLNGVKEQIQIGLDFKVRTVCVRPCDIELALNMCDGTHTDVGCVLGFPHGVVPSSIKAQEAKLYVQLGVKEIDMVVNYSYVRSGEWELVEKDILSVSDVTRQAGVLLKVIFESNMLSIEEVKRTTEICIKAGADYVKTSTGFNGPGATEEAVIAMVEAARGRIKVKASGGIRTLEAAERFIALGCERLGVGSTSTPVLCEGVGSVTGSGY